MRTMHRGWLPCGLLIGLCSVSCSKPYELKVFSQNQVQLAGSDSFAPRIATTRELSVQPDVRLLIVVDNSSSMNPVQAALAAGFQNFSAKFLKAGVKLSVATITTDAYVAGRTGVSNRFGPNNGACMARLLPGVHDGVRPPVAGAFDGAGTFTPYMDDHCQLKPGTEDLIRAAGGRTLRPILSTVPPVGMEADAGYFAQLAADFRINAAPGTGGSGMETGFESLDQFFRKNEERPECAAGTDPSCFFTHYRLGDPTAPRANIVMVVSDEHDQTNASLVDGMPVIDHSRNAIKMMDDPTLIAASQQLAVRTKARLDGFFRSLHGGDANSDPNYAFLAVTNVTCNPRWPCGIKPDTNQRDENELWGIEYVSMVQEMLKDGVNTSAAFSKTYDINQSAYDGLFDMIGNRYFSDTVYSSQDTFTLSRDVSSKDAFTAELRLGDGTKITVDSSLLQLTSPRTIKLDPVLMAMIPVEDTAARLVVTY